MQHERPVIEYAPPPPKRPSRADRVLTFFFGWVFGVAGFLLLMMPVNWLFGRIHASSNAMAVVASAGALSALAGAALGWRWNRTHRRKA